MKMTGNLLAGPFLSQGRFGQVAEDVVGELVDFLDGGGGAFEGEAGIGQGLQRGVFCAGESQDSGAFLSR